MKVGQIFSVAASASDAEAREAVKFLNWTVTDKEAASLLALSRGIPISETQKRVLSDAGKLSPLIIQAEKYARTAGQGLGQDPLIRNTRSSGSAPTSSPGSRSTCSPRRRPPTLPRADRQEIGGTQGQRQVDCPGPPLKPQASGADPPAGRRAPPPAQGESHAHASRAISAKRMRGVEGYFYIARGSSGSPSSGRFPWSRPCTIRSPDFAMFNEPALVGFGNYAKMLFDDRRSCPP
jgi:hypothetical protein